MILQKIQSVITDPSFFDLYLLYHTKKGYAIMKQEKNDEEVTDDDTPDNQCDRRLFSYSCLE